MHPQLPLCYVVQKHAARSLHYDFRLQVGDVLKSWAVPKGPSMDPSLKRLAIEVEDHDLDYRDFEGVIPNGRYGAGAVLIWDRGVYHPAGEAEPAEAIENGRLEFVLNGEKLKGGFVLVRTRMGGKRTNWLLIKRKDSDARPGEDVLDDGKSVLSGRTVEEIAGD